METDKKPRLLPLRKGTPVFIKIDGMHILAEVLGNMCGKRIPVRVLGTTEPLSVGPRDLVKVDSLLF